MRLTGKVAIVTGSTKGIGKVIATKLAAEGAKVVVTGRSEGEGEAVVKDILANGGDAIFLRLDVSQEENVKSMIAGTVEAFGGLDILINNAAAVEFIGAGGDAPLVDLPTEDFDYSLKVGLYGPFWCCKYGIPEMRKRGGGSIIHISSVASLGGVKGVPAYTCVKGALNALARQMAVDYAVDNIRTNTIVVGWVASFDTFAVALAADPTIGKLLDACSLTPPGSPEDIANVATFLASSESSFITGQNIVADGGLTVASQLPDFTPLMDGARSEANKVAASRI